MPLGVMLLAPGWLLSRLFAQPHKPSMSGPLLSVDAQATSPGSPPELQAMQVSEAVVSLSGEEPLALPFHLQPPVCPFRSCRSRFWGSGTQHLILLNTMYDGPVVGGSPSGKEMRGTSVIASESCWDKDAGSLLGK